MPRYPVAVSARHRFEGRRILAAAAAAAGLQVADIVGRARNRHVVALRAEIMKRLSHAGYGSITIGKVLKRDHSTVLYHLAGGGGRKAKEGRRFISQEAANAG